MFVEDLDHGDLHNKVINDVLAAIGDGVIVTDLSGKIVFMNEAAMNITGWLPSEAEGKSFEVILCLYDAVKQQPFPSPIHEVIHTRQSLGLKENCIIYAKNGLKKYLSANISPIEISGRGLQGTIAVFRDITKYKDIENRCLQEEKNLRTVLNSAPVAFIIVDANAVISEVNDAAQSLFKVDRQQAIGKKFGDGFCCRVSINNNEGCGSSNVCRSVCELRNAIGLAYKGIGTSNIEYEQVFIIDGQERTHYFKTSVTPINIDDVIKVTIVLDDITYQKNKENEIRKSRDFYLRIFDGFPCLVWKSNFSSEFQYINKRWQELTGQPADKAFGFGWRDFVEVNDLEKFDSRNQMNGPGEFEWEMRLLDNSGNYRWIYAIQRNYYNLDDVAEGFIGMGFDITDRKKAEDSERKSWEQYRALLMNMVSGFANHRVIFNENNEPVDFEYIEVNEAYERLLDIKRESIIGRKFSELFPCYRHASFLNRFWDVALGYVESAEWEYFSPETKKWLHYSVYSSEKNNFITIVTDISERKMVEYGLRKAKEAAEEGAKAKSEFLANMSHEIRTPINGIMGMIELTLLDGDLDEDYRDNLATAQMCADSLLRIINDILDFSKIEAGKLSMNYTEFNLTNLIDEIIKVHSSQAASKGLVLRTEIEVPINQDISCDPDRIKQILNNLLSNAIKFTEKGTISLNVSEKEISQDEVEVYFTITDTGIGIADNEMDKLFQPFSQVDGSITRRFGGTGLGLTISKRLIEMMGGRIWVESQKGIGSSFSFAFAVKASSSVSSIQSIENPLLRTDFPKEILVVEDDLINQMVTTKMLKEMGHSTEVAADGIQAIDRMAQKKYDLILMDIQMPIIDGIELTKIIRSEEASTNEHVPIIALTAHALQGDRERFLMIGMDDYLAKPVKYNELYYKIENFFKKGSFRRNETDNSFDKHGKLSEQSYLLNSNSCISTKKPEKKIEKK